MTPADASTRALEAQLERTYSDQKGVVGFIGTTSAMAYGKRFIVTAFVFLGLGGILALLMRLQLAVPNNGFLSADLYNQIFTTHGITMMFLFAVPVTEGFALYLVPLMLGTRTVAFPRLTAFGYYVYLFGGVLLYAALLANAAPDVGWFAYVPLSGPEYSPGNRVDVYEVIVTLVEISAITEAVNLIATIFKHRAPGMSLNRMPLFVWSVLVQSFAVVFALPAVLLGSLLLAFDRVLGTHFYNPVESSDPLLWQHIFWWFGHPEVYIILLPGLGIVSSILIVFSRRQVFGYIPLVLSLVATGFLGFGLWVHHMFVAGLPRMGNNFFSAASMMIAIPSGVQIFCWLATMWRGRLWISAAMLHVIGFLILFVLGGMTGMVMASVPLDEQIHDTFYIVAHFHYVLIGGAVFPLLAGLYFWYPKIVGRMLSERLGKLSFWLLFVGFNVTFFPMHQLGHLGMPRRVYTYPTGLNLGDLNLLATAGALVLALGFVTLLANAVLSTYRGRVASADPWGADGLEWATSSPPPSYHFPWLPTVRGRYARWTAAADQPVVVGLDPRRRESLTTSMLDARPDLVVISPGPSLWPPLLALATTAGVVAAVWWTLWAAVGFGAIAAAALIGWFWPRRPRGPGTIAVPAEEGT